MLERIPEADFKRPPHIPFSGLDSIFLHFAISSLLNLGARVVALVSILMSTFEVSFTDQGNHFSSSRFSEPVLTVELNVHQTVRFTNALGELRRGLSKSFDFIACSINL